MLNSVREIQEREREREKKKSPVPRELQVSSAVTQAAGGRLDTSGPFGQRTDGSTGRAALS